MALADRSRYLQRRRLAPYAPKLSKAETHALHYLASMKDQKVRVAALCEYVSAMQLLAQEISLVDIQVKRQNDEPPPPLPTASLQGRPGKDPVDELTSHMAQLAERSNQRMSSIKTIANREKAKRLQEQRLAEKQREEAEQRRAEIQRKRAEAEAKLKEDQSQESQPAAKQDKPVPQTKEPAPKAPPSAAKPAVSAAGIAPAAKSAATAATVVGTAEQRPRVVAGAVQDEYEKLKAEFGPLEAEVKSQAQSGPEAKKVFMDIKREILPKVQAIVPAIPVCKRVINELCEVLARHQQANPLHGFHAMLCLAMKFVPAGATGDVGEHLVYPYAAVGVHVGLAFPKFLRVWLYCMYTHCPLTVPANPSGSKLEEALGRKGQEEADAWNRRVELFMRQYAVFFQTEITPALVPDVLQPGSSSTALTNPVGLDKAWRWLSTFLNVNSDVLRTRRDIWTTALAQVVTKVGYAMLRQYGHQFAKVLDVIQSQYMPLVRPGERSVAGDDTDNASLRVALQLLADFYVAYEKSELNPPEGSALDATATGQAGVDPSQC